MTLDELKRFIDGPLAVYLAGEATYSRFIELLRHEFPELGVKYAHLYPRLFNLDAKPPDDPELPCWDVWAAAEKYLEKVGPVNGEALKRVLERRME